MEKGNNFLSNLLKSPTSEQDPSVNGILKLAHWFGLILSLIGIVITILKALTITNENRLEMVVTAIASIAVFYLGLFTKQFFNEQNGNWKKMKEISSSLELLVKQDPPSLKKYTEEKFGEYKFIFDDFNRRIEQITYGYWEDRTEKGEKQISFTIGDIEDHNTIFSGDLFSEIWETCHKKYAKKGRGYVCAVSVASGEYAWQKGSSLYQAMTRISDDGGYEGERIFLPPCEVSIQVTMALKQCNKNSIKLEEELKKAIEDITCDGRSDDTISKLKSVITSLKNYMSVWEECRVKGEQTNNVKSFLSGVGAAQEHLYLFFLKKPYDENNETFIEENFHPIFWKINRVDGQHIACATIYINDYKRLEPIWKDYIKLRKDSVEILYVTNDPSTIAKRDFKQSPGDLVDATSAPTVGQIEETTPGPGN